MRAADAGAAFATPAVVQFGVVLFLAAIACVFHGKGWEPSLLFGIGGFRWDSVHDHGRSEHESANRLPAGI